MPDPVAELRGSFERFRDEIDSHNDKRERLIKASRDITALSKKLIFHLHRFSLERGVTRLRHHKPHCLVKLTPSCKAFTHNCLSWHKRKDLSVTMIVRA